MFFWGKNRLRFSAKCILSFQFRTRIFLSMHDYVIQFLLPLLTMDVEEWHVTRQAIRLDHLDVLSEENSKYYPYSLGFQRDWISCKIRRI